MNREQSVEFARTYVADLLSFFATCFFINTFKNIRSHSIYFCLRINSFSLVTENSIEASALKK